MSKKLESLEAISQKGKHLAAAMLIFGEELEKLDKETAEIDSMIENISDEDEDTIIRAQQKLQDNQLRTSSIQEKMEAYKEDVAALEKEIAGLIKKEKSRGKG
jgi:multidrug efflux pump subunit AcrA (membrane-fusion protein)